MKRHESRNKSRAQKNIENLNPCVNYSRHFGTSPHLSPYINDMKRFDDIGSRFAIHIQKMMKEKAMSKKRKARKKNKV
jgi:hypothetical protein